MLNPQWLAYLLDILKTFLLKSFKSLVLMWAPNARYGNSVDSSKGGYSPYWPGGEYVDIAGQSQSLSSLTLKKTKNKKNNHHSQTFTFQETYHKILFDFVSKNKKTHSTILLSFRWSVQYHSSALCSAFCVCGGGRGGGGKEWNEQC